MLGTVLILLACVNGIFSSAYAPYHAPTNNGYQQNNRKRNDIRTDLRSLNDAINDAYRADEKIADRLVEATEEDVRNTEQTDEFLEKQFRELRIRQINQSRDMEDVERRAEQLLLLTDDVAVLNSTVGELQRQVNELEKESLQIQNEANELQHADAVQEHRLAYVKAQLAKQNRTLEELEKETTSFSNSLNNNLELVENITTIVDQEQGEVVIAILTSEEPNQKVLVDNDYRGVAPIVFYGFSSIHISDESQSYVLPNNYATKGYGGYEASLGELNLNASIKFNINVQYGSETNQLSYSLVDSSTGGITITEIVVAATLINIDNNKVNNQLNTPYY